MSQRYFDNWGSHEDVLEAFCRGPYNYNTNAYDPVVTPEDFPTDEEILFATYFEACWSGYAVVIFQRGGKLFETTASHCSCNGLGEGGWPGASEVTAASLALRLKQLNERWGFLDDAEAQTRDAFRALVEQRSAVAP